MDQESPAVRNEGGNEGSTEASSSSVISGPWYPNKLVSLYALCAISLLQNRAVFGLGLGLPERTFQQLSQHVGDSQHLLVAPDIAGIEPHAAEHH